MHENKKGLIDGFIITKKRRVITLKDGIYTIFYNPFTYEQAVENIKRKHSGKKKQKVKIQKLHDCQTMEWLTDKVHNQLKNDKDWFVRLAVAKYSDIHHKQLKTDDCFFVRLAVAMYSDTHHEELKNDGAWQVREAVAEYSNAHHNELKNDEDYRVRRAVENYKPNPKDC